MLSKTRASIGPFGEEHLKAFAAFSRDFNPLHLDPVYAERTQFGQRIVYGVQVLLAGIEAILDEPCQLTRIQSRFVSPVPLGESVEVLVSSQSDTRLQLRYSCKGRIAANAAVWLKPGSPAYVLEPEGNRSALPELALSQRSLEDFGQGEEGQIVCPINPTALSKALLKTQQSPVFINSAQAAAYALCSAVVGMRLPGRLAVFIGLDADASIETADASVNDVALGYRLSNISHEDRTLTTGLFPSSGAVRVQGSATAYVMKPYQLDAAHSGSPKRLSNVVLTGS
jgi:polyketide synthase PksJ